ncbi:MMPL family transporter [Glycomyces sp. L485]|uniref:MMPL family transporter n=1 Tax=Glycomyces sp. L485 TaxID=2909235 RepID=UPI001F4AC11E|nr:MMPL family transporter [Glycomyces sp. L485]MCH7230240.1 MMPL family transporter [Glycomyces sp. L485]
MFGAFMLSEARLLQQFGIGLAVAIFIDAIVIRCLLVPAIMKIMGRAAWWMPRWLDRVLPHVTVEPEAEAPRAQQREPAHTR